MTRLDQSEQKSAEMCWLLNQEKEHLWVPRGAAGGQGWGGGDTQELRRATIKNW